MTANRPQLRMVLLVLTSFLLLLLRAEDVTTSGYQDSLPVAGVDARQNVNTEASSGYRRQSRMSSHVELPSSKAKREQALRSLLTERRRQILNQRSAESSHLPNRTPRPIESPSKDSPDVLEAQETRHGIYVTASVGSPTDDPVEQGTGSQERKNEKGSNGEEDQPEIKAITEETTASAKSGNFTTAVIDSGKLNSNSARNHHIQRNSTVGSVGNSSIAPLTAPKNSESDGRKKNTFVMPESLYNHFRPVESNIPVEDMSQFLYFGQKLQPGLQNTTSNNSVEVTPTVPTLPSSRRRYSMKRYTTTTTTTAMSVPKLEDIMNEEMNIAIERQTVEKNTVSKIKNAFRSAGSGIYYRKARPMDSTIASNVIPANESGRNTTENEARSEMDPRDDKSRAEPSAHAKDQLRGAEQRGSAAHVHDETWNATDSTQISSQRRRLSANTHGQDNKDESSSAKSEIDDLELGFSVTSANKSTVLPGAQTTDRKTSETAEGEQQRSKTNNSSIVAEILPAETARSDNQKKRDPQNSTVTVEATNSTQITDPDIVHFDSTDDTIAVDKTNNDRSELMSMDTIVADRQRDFSTSRESNNIESSTANDKTYTSLDRTTWTTSNPEESSSLRIVVTEVNVDRHFTSAGFESGQGNTVKPLDRTEKRVIPGTSVGLPPLKRGKTTMGSSVVSEGVGEPGTGAPVASAISPMQQQAQHVYAYTITNVTRLLRNYTGPGLSREEQGGPYRSTGTAGRAEITSRAGQHTESAQQQQQQQQHHQQEPQEQQEPPAQSPLLPRAGSIDSERLPAELSTGTTVVEARTTVASLPSSIAAGTTLVGERARKVAPATQHSQRAQNRPIHLHPPAVNKTVAPARSRLPEAPQRGSVRWNHTKSRLVDFDGANDRRFLRKSASAVLNQRIGSSADEDSLNLSNKRRRVQGILYPSQSIYRRVKGLTTVKSVEGPVNAGLLGLNDSVTSDRKNSVTDKKEDDVSAGPLGTMQLDRVNKSENFEGELAVMSSMESSVDHSFVLSDEKVQDETVNATTTTNDGTVGEGVVEFDTKDESGASKNEIKFGGPGDQSAAMASVSGDGENVEQGNGSRGGSATERPKESNAYKETVRTTTVSGPIFPATPRILPYPGNLGSKETFTLTPTEPLNQGTEKPAELDPSEIQKLYRSNSSSTTETPTTTTTTTTTTRTTTIGAESQSVRESATGAPVGPVYRKPESWTATPSVEIQKESAVERSPEVRGRNLSDKTKDKDNVLPIMHLYNTSRIFNGSESMGEGPLEGDSPRVVLPIDDEIIEDTRTTTAATTTTRRRPSGEERSNSSRVPVDGSKETTSAPSSAKRDRQEENREVHSSHELTNGPARLAGHAHSSGNAARTKHHRPSPSPPPPVYRQTILPDYNGSVYPNEMNRTFFEAGLISAGPRDTVNISEVISKRHDGDAIASQETVAVVSYILATLVVFPIAVGVGLILRRLIIRNRKVLEESDTSSEISCRKDALNLENGDFKTSIEKAITKLPRIQHLCHEAEKPPPPPTQESRWEFPRDKLRLQTVLGQGNFGQVWKAEADDLTGHQGTTRLVAVKTVKEGASDREKEDLVRELEIMQQLGSHPNVVTLLGCCTEEEPHYLILEYVMYGKLLAYLRDHRTRQDFYNFSEDSAALTSRDLTVFGYCVARGMEYLASKKIIHRDLAARNVLVDHNKLCKIADFGMSRFANEDGEVIETRRERNALPIRWMAPESLIYSLFTTKTDVWSFGILMWEIVTLGSTPYPDMTAREVMCNVQNGYRLERPSHCRSELFRVISRCWHAVPDRRPEFQTLRRDLAQLLEDNMNGHYVDLESFASECTD